MTGTRSDEPPRTKNAQGIHRGPPTAPTRGSPSIGVSSDKEDDHEHVVTFQKYLVNSPPDPNLHATGHMIKTAPGEPTMRMDND